MILGWRVGGLVSVRGEHLGGELEWSFGEIGEWLHVEVARAVEPFLVLFGGEGAQEAQAARVVWEDAHDQRTAFEFLVEAFEEVGAFEVFVMGVREAVKSEGFLDLLLNPGGEFGVFGLPVFEPGGEVLAGFRGVAPVVKPDRKSVV